MSDSEVLSITKFDFDNRWNGIITFKCNECGRSIKKKLKDLKPKADIVCGCGVKGTISDDGFRSAQKQLDGLKKSINSFKI